MCIFQINPNMFRSRVMHPSFSEQVLFGSKVVHPRFLLLSLTFCRHQLSRQSSRMAGFSGLADATEAPTALSTTNLHCLAVSRAGSAARVAYTGEYIRLLLNK